MEKEEVKKEEVKKEETKIKVEEVKEKVEEVKEKLKEKLDEPKEKRKKMKALVTSRILFISALDKIYLVTLLLMFVGLTWANFAGDLSSVNYGFWSRVGSEIIIVISMFIYYLFFNWFYKCAAKTMLCLTRNQVYKETYVPFKRSETSLPLEKITGVTTYNVFWIFRTLIIHQYGKLPLIFFTWNNQEFKDKLNELITSDKDKIENEYEDKNIISKSQYKYLMYLAIALLGTISLIGISRFFSYISSPERKIPGVYTYNTKQIILNKDGSCNIDDLEDNVTECTWFYSDSNEKINISYEYQYYYSYYYGSTTRYDNIYLDYNSSRKTLTYDNEVYVK